MDLRTSYMGLPLKHPIVASASPLSKTFDGIKRLEDAGASAVVMFSMFEEQIRQETELYDYFSFIAADSFAESLSYFPPIEDFKVKPSRYLDLLHKATTKCDIPIIASLNGVTCVGWTDYARQMEQAGAKAIELNVYSIPLDISLSGRDVEKRIIEVVASIRKAVAIPVSVKISPYFSSTGNMACKLVDAGADGLVLFNRFYQPDFDLDLLEAVSNLQLSTPSEIRLPLLWIAVLHGRLKCSLAASSGVASGAEVVKYIMAGADVVMTTSALLEKGVRHMTALVDELTRWMEEREYESVRQMKGSMSQQKVADPSAFARANYLKVLQSFRPRP